VVVDDRGYRRSMSATSSTAAKSIKLQINLLATKPLNQEKAAQNGFKAIGLPRRKIQEGLKRRARYAPLVAKSPAARSAFPYLAIFTKK